MTDTASIGVSYPPDQASPITILDASSVWDKSVDVLKNQLDPQIFTAWIKPLSIAGVAVTPESVGIPSSTTEIELVAPNKFCCEHVKRNYEALISSTLTDVLGIANVVLRFRVKSPTTYRDQLQSAGPLALKSLEKVKGKSEIQARPRVARVHDDSNLNQAYNFSNFVVGACNQFAHAVSLRVSENLGSAYNPLFVYGGVGLGKTHLVNAIGNASRRRGKSVLLVSSEIFVNELIAALRSNKMPQFKSKFRSLDLLIIDDIQFIIGKERTQEEFFHTFNDLHQKRKQIIVTSDKIPQELIGLEERLRTRFSSGLSADLQAPDFETRVAILAKKSEAGGIELPDEVARLLAERIDTNVRELEGALNRLHALGLLHKTPISLTLAEEALRSFLPEKNREITAEGIQKLVAERYYVGLSDLSGKRRTQNIAFARHVAMYLCRHLTGSSYPEIGAMFGGRDHSTVIHATRVIEERIRDDAGFRNDVETMKKTLRG